MFNNAVVLPSSEEKRTKPTKSTQTAKARSGKFMGWRLLGAGVNCAIVQWKLSVYKYHSPMETERVQVPSGVFRAFQVREPRHHALRLRVHADRVPSARDEVRADRQAHQEPDDLEEGEQWGREDEVENSLHDVEELQQTHHASHPNAPRDPHQSGRFANAHHVHGLDAVDELEDQVRGDHEQIEPEPSSQVLAGDLVYPHLGAPVRELEAHEEV
mmetsp:Transcript_58217/g.188447  ORF Transcript_58217/g.188447 Transcript_58217/m.188447 type:complete len:215 (-) Transcript_58217:744-1388(-)